VIRTFSQILAEGTSEEILAALQAALDKADESPFWATKVIPLAEAVLSVLIPLRDRQLLFTPEGEPQETLTPELVLRWCDLVSLKTLAFTLQKSNDSGQLERTKHSAEEARRYRHVDLETLAKYLGSYTVDLKNESLDFPIAHYNLHVGISDVLSKLMK